MEAAIASSKPRVTPASETAPSVTIPARVIDPALKSRYMSLVGALLYASTHTRPDVAYAVGLLCRAMSCPTPELLLAAERVLWYLHRHRDLGLRFHPSDASLVGYSDSDWARRHSTSGSVFLYGAAAISWTSKKQASVALSSCEAEIMAVSEAAKDAVYLREFLSELGYPDPEPTALKVDNQAARDLAYNPEHHQRTKHIDRRHFYVREVVEELRIVVPFVPTDANVADFFTKALPADKFLKFRQIVMNLEPYTQSPTPGGFSLLSLNSECGGVSHSDEAKPRGCVGAGVEPGLGSSHGPGTPYQLSDG